MYLSNFKYLYPLQRYSPPKFEVIQNHAKFCMFSDAEIFRERTLKILDQDYKIEHTSDHGAKFCGNQLTELGDLTRRKNNKHQQI